VTLTTGIVRMNQTTRAIAVQAREPTASEIWGALGRSAIRLFDTMQNNARERAWSDYPATDTRQPDAVEPVVDRWEQRQKQTQTEEAARRRLLPPGLPGLHWVSTAGIMVVETSWDTEEACLAMITFNSRSGGRSTWAIP
jgi:hypothetical protein